MSVDVFVYFFITSFISLLKNKNDCLLLKKHIIFIIECDKIVSTAKNIGKKILM